MKFSRGKYQSDSPEKETLYCFYCSPLNLCSPQTEVSKIGIINLNSKREGEMNRKKRMDKVQDKNAMKTTFLLTNLKYKWGVFSATSNIHPGIFTGWTSTSKARAKIRLKTIGLMRKNNRSSRAF